MATYTLVGGPFSGQQRTIPDDSDRLTLPTKQPLKVVPQPSKWPAIEPCQYSDYLLRSFTHNDPLGKPVRKVRVLVWTGMSDTEACEWLNKNA